MIVWRVFYLNKVIILLKINQAERQKTWNLRFLVGVERFELSASSSRTKRANRAALHPDNLLILHLHLQKINSLSLNSKTINLINHVL